MSMRSMTSRAMSARSFAWARNHRATGWPNRPSRVLPTRTATLRGFANTSLPSNTGAPRPVVVVGISLLGLPIIDATSKMVDSPDARKQHSAHIAARRDALADLRAWPALSLGAFTERGAPGRGGSVTAHLLRARPTV